MSRTIRYKNKEQTVTEQPTAGDRRMTWREQIVVKILLMVARMFTDDEGLSDEIRNLRNHISISRTD